MTTAFDLKYRLENHRYPYSGEEVRSQVPADRIGVYAIWEPSGVTGGHRCIYLGKSETCVRRRLLAHLRQSEPNADLRRMVSLYPDILTFSAAFTETPEEADALETQIINDWAPNTNHNKLGKRGGE